MENQEKKASESSNNQSLPSFFEEKGFFGILWYTIFKNPKRLIVVLSSFILITVVIAASIAVIEIEEKEAFRNYGANLDLSNNGETSFSFYGQKIRNKPSDPSFVNESFQLLETSISAFLQETTSLDFITGFYFFSQVQVYNLTEIVLYYQDPETFRYFPNEILLGVVSEEILTLLQPALLNGKNFEEEGEVYAFQESPLLLELEPGSSFNISLKWLENLPESQTSFPNATLRIVDTLNYGWRNSFRRRSLNIPLPSDLLDRLGESDLLITEKGFDRLLQQFSTFTLGFEGEGEFLYDFSHVDPAKLSTYIQGAKSLEKKEGTLSFDRNWAIYFGDDLLRALKDYSNVHWNFMFRMVGLMFPLFLLTWWIFRIFALFTEDRYRQQFRLLKLHGMANYKLFFLLIAERVLIVPLGVLIGFFLGGVFAWSLSGFDRWMEWKGFSYSWSAIITIDWALISLVALGVFFLDLVQKIPLACSQDTDTAELTGFLTTYQPRKPMWERYYWDILLLFLGLILLPILNEINTLISKTGSNTGTEVEAFTSLLEFLGFYFLIVLIFLLCLRVYSTFWDIVGRRSWSKLTNFVALAIRQIHGDAGRYRGMFIVFTVTLGLILFSLQLGASFENHQVNSARFQLASDIRCSGSLPNSSVLQQIESIPHVESVTKISGYSITMKEGNTIDLVVIDPDKFLETAYWPKSADLGFNPTKMLPTLKNGTILLHKIKNRNDPTANLESLIIRNTNRQQSEKKFPFSSSQVTLTILDARFWTFPGIFGEWTARTAHLGGWYDNWKQVGIIVPETLELLFKVVPSTLNNLSNSTLIKISKLKYIESVKSQLATIVEGEIRTVSEEIAKREDPFSTFILQLFRLQLVAGIFVLVSFAALFVYGLMLSRGILLETLRRKGFSFRSLWKQQLLELWLAVYGPGLVLGSITAFTLSFIAEDLLPLNEDMFQFQVVLSPILVIIGAIVLTFLVNLIQTISLRFLLPKQRRFLRE